MGSRYLQPMTAELPPSPLLPRERPAGAPCRDADIIVIGAGAAGLACAHALAGDGFRVRVIEARDRLGGRAHTRLIEGLPLDLGCHWLHSAERNPWTAITEDLGFTLDRTPPPWEHEEIPTRFPLEAQSAYDRAQAAFRRRVKAHGSDAIDLPASDLLEPGNPWNPLIEAVSTYYSGAETAKLSTIDLAAYRDDGINWRIRQGYGAVVARYGRQCPVDLATRVTAIDHSGPRVAVETDRGTLQADAVVVTVPTPHIAGGHMAFRPELPGKRAAAEGLPLGLADKVIFALDEVGDLPIEGHATGRPDLAATGSYHIRPLGRPLIEGFLGGDHALTLELAGTTAAFDFAATELAGILGSGIRRRIRPLLATAWARDPDARGAYSYARPGRRADRAILAAPVDGRIFFAGEATSAEDYSTAHGAYESGMRAAREIREAFTTASSGA